MNIKNITEEMIQDFAESKKILARGIDYFKNGKIKEIQLLDEKIMARVKGSSGIYSIEISVDDTGIKASCDCPYNKDNCKHSVAVLYKWLDSKIETESVKDPHPLDKLSKDELLSILKKIPKDILRKLM